MSTTIQDELDKRKAVRESRKVGAAERYLDAIRAKAANRELDDAALAVVLDDAGMSEEQYVGDCLIYLKRVAMRELVDAKTLCEDELARVQEQITASVSERQAAYDKITVNINVLVAERSRLNDTVAAANSAEHELRRTAWPYITAKIAEIRKQLQPSCEERRTLEAHIRGLCDNIAALKRTNEYRRKHYTRADEDDIAKRAATISLQQERLADAERRLVAYKELAQPLLDEISRLEAEMLQP